MTRTWLRVCVTADRLETSRFAYLRVLSGGGFVSLLINGVPALFLM